MDAVQHPGLLMDAQTRARLQRQMWDDRQVFDENRYNAFAPRGPHYLEYHMVGSKMRAKQMHMELDRRVAHTSGDKHGECSSHVRTNENFQDLCADRLPRTPPRPCSEKERKRREERRCARDLAAEEKLFQRLRERQERKQLAESIVTFTPRSLVQRQRAARESRSRALAAGPPRGAQSRTSALYSPQLPIKASDRTDGTAVHASPPSPALLSGAGAVAADEDSPEALMEALVDAASEADEALKGNSTALARCLSSTSTAGQHREAWERWRRQFGEGSDEGRTQTERQRVLRNYVPSMGDVGEICRVPANCKLPGKARLSSEKCEKAFIGTLRQYPSPRGTPRHRTRFGGALWPGDRSAGRMPWADAKRYRTGGATSSPGMRMGTGQRKSEVRV
eukprot:CAMPEP_0115842898 /NCGR_PEP_ID=MMETSP0287-20121206/8035_1 /TAXON_ID=412157 /ORGANISM="Chrysochromulina rotalis, Strain UIO044" /LENGTH=393 /DNA_ID=CAMNT_0003296577 /DNA_START=18 /DNA_END=1199 /DNA_ORIENTATION=+